MFLTVLILILFALISIRNAEQERMLQFILSDEYVHSTACYYCGSTGGHFCWGNL